MTNPIIDAIKNRRSTRQFTDEQIMEEQMDTLLESAIWAADDVLSRPCPRGSICRNTGV
ncbi:nitroreductase family protein [Lacrimispora sp.]|uniref:nitroreductase family protein n=1 Tax=Lacrimispora sp. TaxID=2719234 RepID=UPI00267941F9